MLKKVDDEVDAIVGEIAIKLKWNFADKDWLEKTDSMKELVRKRMTSGDKLVDKIAEACITSTAVWFQSFYEQHPFTTLDGNQVALNIMKMKDTIISSLKGGKP